MLCVFIPERRKALRMGLGGEVQERRAKAQKDKPEGPSHLEGWCARVPPLPGAFSRPSGQASATLCRRRGLGGELLPVVCYEIVPKLLKQRRSSQLQQRKTQTMTAPPLNKEERHYS